MVLGTTWTVASQPTATGTRTRYSWYLRYCFSKEHQSNIYLSIMTPFAGKAKSSILRYCPIFTPNLSSRDPRRNRSVILQPSIPARRGATDRFVAGSALRSRQRDSVERVVRPYTVFQRPYFWNSQSRLSSGQTCRALSHLDMQWKWNAWLQIPQATVHSSLAAEAWFA